MIEEYEKIEGCVFFAFVRGINPPDPFLCVIFFYLISRLRLGRDYLYHSIMTDKYEKIFSFNGYDCYGIKIQRSYWLRQLRFLDENASG